MAISVKGRSTAELELKHNNQVRIATEWMVAKHLSDYADVVYDCLCTRDISAI